MHMENLLETVEQTPLEDCQSTEILTANLYKQIVSFMEKGILTEQEEMDFCSMADVVLDEDGLTNQDARVKTLNATDFPQYLQRIISQAPLWWGVSLTVEKYM